MGRFWDSQEVASGFGGSAVQHACVSINWCAILTTINIADCEVSGVMRFLTAKNKSMTDIHCELCSVCREDVMSRPLVSRWRQSYILKEEQFCLMNNEAVTPPLLTT